MHSPSESGVNISNPSTEPAYQQQTPGLDYTVQRRDHITATPPYQAHAMIAATPAANQHMISKCFYFNFFRQNKKINVRIYL